MFELSTDWLRVRRATHPL